jgi:hypothetical protein
MEEDNLIITKLNWFSENKIPIFIRTKNNFNYVINDFIISGGFIIFKDKFRGTDIFISLDNIAQLCKSIIGEKKNG